MAISRVTSQAATGSSAVATLTLTYPATPTQNDLLIAVVECGYATAVATAATATGWTQAWTVNFNGSLNSTTMLYKIAGAGETTTVSLASSAATTMLGQVQEYTGNRPYTADVLDRVATSGTAGAGTSLTSGTTATTQLAEELVFVAMGQSGTVTSPTFSNGLSLVTSQTQLNTADLAVGATGAYASTVSWTNSFAAGGGVATFKAISGGKFNQNPLRPRSFAPGLAR